MVETEKVREVNRASIRPAIQADAGDIFPAGRRRGDRRGHRRARGAPASRAPRPPSPSEGRCRAHPEATAQAGGDRGRRRQRPGRVPGQPLTGRGGTVPRRCVAARPPSCSTPPASATAAQFRPAAVDGRAGRRGRPCRRPGRPRPRAGRLHRGHHRCPRRREVDADQRAGGRRASAGRPGGGAGHRPVVPLQRRGHPRRPCAHGRARAGRGRVHPVDGDPGPPRRAGRVGAEAVRVLTVAGFPWCCSRPWASAGRGRGGRARRHDDGRVTPAGGRAVQANKAGSWRSPTCSWSTRPTWRPTRPPATRGGCWRWPSPAAAGAAGALRHGHHGEGGGGGQAVLDHRRHLEATSELVERRQPGGRGGTS